MASVESLLDQALQLSPEDRADLAQRLLQTLEKGHRSLSADEWVAAWKPELERRVQAHERGETVAMDWRESLERVRNSLPERHSP